MVGLPKNIQWWWLPQKPLKISNGLFKTIEMSDEFLETIEIVNGLLKSMQFTVFSKKNGSFLWSQLLFSILMMLFCTKVRLATASNPWYSLQGIAVANQTLLITQGKWFILSSWIINSAAVPISGEINVGKPLLCCTVCNLHCKVSMDGSPTDVNAVNLHFVENWFYALSCAMVHANHR